MNDFNICVEQKNVDTTGSSGIVVEREVSSSDIIFKAKQDGTTEKRELKIEFRFPALDVAGQWSPCCGMNRALNADWCGERKSTVAISAPMIHLFSDSGYNRMTVACSETEKPVYMRAGVHEENGWIHMSVRIPLGEDDFPYEMKLYIDQRNIPYEQAIHEAAVWWQEKCGLQPMQTPEFARDPVYSTWYSYHQEVCAEALEKEAKLAADMGFGTMILDDGWQTTDNNRGYAYCGDWEVAEEKMGNMADHVRRVHEAGLRYMIWFSVPFIGKYAKAWERFSGKILRFEEGHGAGVLDLRYPEVRQYLISIYERAVRDWDMDGVKLDFIDEFYTEDGSVAPEGTDIPGIEHAVAVFLKEVRDALCKIKPDVLVEFRQYYVGPSIRSAGNLVRVGDCPMSGMNNRVGSMDIRLISTDTAIHSDMVMWNREEAAEDAVRQLQQTLFSTLQLSVRLEEQTEKQKQAIRYWVGFMKKYRDVLQKSELHPKDPQFLYPVISANDESVQIQVTYEESRILCVNDNMKENICINATAAENIYLRCKENHTYKIEQYNYYGQLLQTEQMVLKQGIHEYPVGKSGFVKLTKQ